MSVPSRSRSLHFRRSTFRRALALAVVAAPAGVAGAEPAAQDARPAEAAPERIVIRAARQPEHLAGSAIRTEIVDPGDARAIQAVKLSDALEYTPGLRIDSTCQNCNATEIRLLGLPQRYVAVLQDGIPMLSGLAGVYGLEQVPIALVDRIEVIKGGGSTLYGPGAVAGVVNLVPRIARRTGGSLEVSGNVMPGSGGAWRPNRDLTFVGDIVGEGGTAGVTLYGMNSHVNAVDVNGDGYSEVSRRGLVVGGLRGWWKPVEGSRLLLDYMGSGEQRRGGEMSGGALDRAPDTVGIAEDLDSRRHTGTAVWEQDVGEATQVRLAGSVSDMVRDSYYGGTGPLGGPTDPDWDPGLPFASAAPRDPVGDPIPPFNVDPVPGLGFGTTEDRLYFLDGMVSWMGLEGHTFTVGLQYRLETLTDAAVYRTFRDEYRNLGVVLQDDWHLGEAWELVYGVRVDDHSLLREPVVSPRAAVLWQAREDLRWRAAVSTGFRGPELFDEDLHIGNVGGDLQVVRRSPGLEEERSVTATLGPEWRVGERWVIDANAFYTRLTGTFFNELDADQPDPGLQRRTKVNAGGAKVFGGELNLAYRVADSWRAEVGWVEQRSRYDEAQLHLGDPTGADPVDNPIFSRDFVRVPERYGVARLFWTPGAWQLFAGGRLTGPTLVPHVMNDLEGDRSPLAGSYPGQPMLLGNRMETSPWTFVMDVSVSRTWKRERGMEVVGTVGCRNLFDTFQDDLDRGRYRDATYSWGPRFPRTLFVTVGVNF